MITQKQLSRLLPGFKIVAVDNGHRTILETPAGEEIAEYTMNTDRWTVKRDHEHSTLILNQLDSGGGETVEYEPVPAEEIEAEPPKKAHGWGNVDGVLKAMRAAGGSSSGTTITLGPECVIQTGNYKTARALYTKLLYERRARFKPRMGSLDISFPAELLKDVPEFFKDE